LIVLLVAGALAVLCCGIGAVVVATSGGDNKPDASDGTQAGATPGAGVGLNQPARDGKFEFTVSEVECGKSKVGTDVLSKTAQGQFCLVTMTVNNIGEEARTFDASNQKATGEGGVEYLADGEASLYLEESKSFLTDINPGNSVTGVVVFDIPKDGEIKTLELHDSAFSGGVAVNVS
jgi:hypothetical protein